MRARGGLAEHCQRALTNLVNRARAIDPPQQSQLLVVRHQRVGLLVVLLKPTRQHLHRVVLPLNEPDGNLGRRRIEAEMKDPPGTTSKGT